VEWFLTVVLIAGGGLAVWLAGYGTYRLSRDMSRDVSRDGS
jgi:hypothetical protein